MWEDEDLLGDELRYQYNLDKAFDKDIQDKIHQRQNEF